MTNKSAILEALEKHGPLTHDDLVDKTGLSTNSISPVLAKLRKNSIIYISGWQRGKLNVSRAIYALGTGLDAPKPRPFTVKERVQAYRNKRSMYGKPKFVNSVFVLGAFKEIPEIKIGEK